MGSAISFRLNPKNESDKKILDWLGEKSSQPGFLNQTEAIKKAILTAIDDERKENREKSIEDLKGCNRLQLLEQSAVQHRDLWVRKRSERNRSRSRLSGSVLRMPNHPAA